MPKFTCIQLLPYFQPYIPSGAVGRLHPDGVNYCVQPTLSAVLKKVNMKCGFSIFA
jgi:hypothetical protein